MPKIFIDGQVGTTGLQIADRLKQRDDVRLIEIPVEQRKDVAVKKEFLNSADLVILCLPDEAARESVRMVENPMVKILDASTAHRVHPDWVYGLPELNADQRSFIKTAKRVANPGCYSTGFILTVWPLVRDGILPSDYPVTLNAVSGYSGGGRKMIETYEQQKFDGPNDHWSYRKYGLNLSHKHIPEMTKYSGLSFPPVFEPAVARIQQGMLVSVPLQIRLLKGGVTIEDIHVSLRMAYKDEPFINVKDINATEPLDNGFLSLSDRNHTNQVDIFLYGHDQQVVLVSRLDNLGKGASGAAIQNMNLMLGLEETAGLN